MAARHSPLTREVGWQLTHHKDWVHIHWGQGRASACRDLARVWQKASDSGPGEGVAVNTVEPGKWEKLLRPWARGGHLLRAGPRGMVGRTGPG